MKTEYWRLHGKKSANRTQKETVDIDRAVSCVCVCVCVCVTARVKKVKRGVCMVGIIFPHTGSPTLRQMENRKGEQGEIQLSQVFCSSSVLIAVCVCARCVRVCVFSVCQVLFTSGAHFKWDRQLKD